MPRPKKGRPPPKAQQAQEVPPGFDLLHTLPGQGRIVWEIAWSPDGRTLASGTDGGFIHLWDSDSGIIGRTLNLPGSDVFSLSWSRDGQMLASGSRGKAIRIWDAAKGACQRTIESRRGDPIRVAWSPVGTMLASGFEDGTVRVWQVETFKSVCTLKGHTGWVRGLAWSPDGRTLASGSGDRMIRLWDTASGTQIGALEGHSASVDDVTFTPDGHTLVSASRDETIRIWDLASGRQLNILEGHTGEVHGVQISADGRLLASKSEDGTVWLWRLANYSPIAILADASRTDRPIGSIRFHPTKSMLATLGKDDVGSVRIWRLDYDALLGAKQIARRPDDVASHYSNAKVVLVGNTSVGKTGLGLVLAGRKFRATESSHGRHVWVLDEEEIERRLPGEGGRAIKTTRETLLWDLAGQPGYRLIHQLHLHEVAVALVVFDSRSETEPLAGVSYWARALDEATRGFPLIKFLVAARIDRGGIAVSRDRLDAIVEKYGFQTIFETSAKRGDGLKELKDAIRQAIPWQDLPIITSTALLKAAKRFLIDQKRRGSILSTRAELLQTFRSNKSHSETTDDAFVTCLGRLEAAKLIRPLSFGDMVLLQPEMLDSYCGWLALAARDQPDGLGFISEDRVLNGDFCMDRDRPLAGKRERTMLLATVQEILARNIGIRQQTAKGPNSISFRAQR